MTATRSLVQLGALCLLITACGGSAPKPTPPMVCFLPRDAAAPIRANDWVELLTRPKVWQQQIFADQDCTGAAIWWEPPDKDCVVKSPLLEAPKPTQLREGDIYERVVSDQVRLVWVVTHRFESGDGFGPIAVVRIHRRGLEVEAIGALRMRTERVNLELWHIGQRGVIVARGEHCAVRGDRSSCKRAANVLVHHKNVLFSPMLTYPNGRCIDEPWIELERQEDQPLESGWNRHFELRSSISHDHRYLVITEQVAIRDFDPTAPAVPAREVRRIDTERFIHLEGPRLVTRQHPLWPRVLPSAGSTELSEDRLLSE